MKSSSFAKVGFVLSIAVLSVLYGYAARWHGWPPDAVLEQAQRQLDAYVDRAFLTSRVYDRAGTRTVAPSEIQPGLTLITSLWSTETGWQTGARLVDTSGTVVHQWPIDRAALFPDSLGQRGGSAPSNKVLHGTHLQPNGDLLVNVDYVGTVRLDACGTVQWSLPEGTHHAIDEAADGSFWMPALHPTQRRASDRYPEGYPGLNTPVWIDQLLHVSAQGTVLDRITVLDVLYDNNLQRYLARAHQPQGKMNGLSTPDVTHLNDIESLPPRLADEYPLFEAGDLLLSLRNLHLVLVLDPDSGVVKWHASEPFIMQHDPDFIGDGWIGVFDNNTDRTERGTMTGGSRIVALQPHTDSVTIRFPTAQSGPFHTPKMGKWQHLENGNLLLTEAQAGRAVEVNPKGETVWELVHAPYSATKTPIITQATRYPLTRSAVEDWTCSDASESSSPTSR